MVAPTPNSQRASSAYTGGLPNACVPAPTMWTQCDHGAHTRRPQSLGTGPPTIHSSAHSSATPATSAGAFDTCLMWLVDSVSGRVFRQHLPSHARLDTPAAFAV